MELFHASGLLYETGDVVQPGNWGRVVLGAGPRHLQFYRELMFEEVRERIVPGHPSRLRSFFGLRTIEDLRRYQQTEGVPYGYRVVVPDSAPTYLADLATFHRLQVVRDHTSANEVIAAYWSGAPAEFMEVLVEAPAEVVERL